ncbi:MAG: hypothetical protein HKM04_00465 [Legionellales bacterium]|nr:hypothetical protein [Legionellales bacterium]
MKIKHFITLIMLFFVSTAFGSSSTGRFLALSDLHFNPYRTCVRQKVPCALIQALQAAPADQWAAILQKQDSAIPSQYGSDMNAALLISTLNEIKKLPQNYQFVILTGDLLGHHYHEYFQQFTNDTSVQDYQQFVNKTNTYLQLQLEKTFSGIPIYLIPGNNDGYEGDYNPGSASGFYKNMTQLWQRTIPNPENKASFESTYPQAGYYAITVKNKTQTTNRVIFLNSVLFSIFASGSNIQALAQQELAWLQKQLEDAKQNNQLVWLVYHIPNGISPYATAQLKLHMYIDAPIPFWQSQYNTAFLNLITQYPGTITALITAHEHMDAFRLINNASSTPLLNASVPAISPVYGNNPAFKLYEYNPDTLQLTNFQTYYFNEQNGNWELEYDFNTAYKSDCKTCSILNIYSSITQTGWRTDLYQKYYDIEANNQLINQKAWLPYYWCAIGQQTEEGYLGCLGT